MPKPGSPEWQRRVDQIAAWERTLPVRWFYLSFATSEKFLGAVILEAQGITTAIQKAHALRINPGGEVRCYEMPEGAAANVPPHLVNRLCSLRELENVYGPLERVRE